LALEVKYVYDGKVVVQNRKWKEVRHMYKVNETISGYDLAELLHGESGIFEGISPSGERFQVVCRAGHSISNLRLQPDKKGESPLWRVRKVGELRAEEQTA